MASLIRFGSCLLTVGTVAMVGLHVVPQAVRSSELNPWRIVESSCHLQAENVRSAELARRNREVMESVHAKAKVVEDFLEQRITLREAAEEFEWLNKKSPRFDLAKFREQFKGETDHERFCRQVVAHAVAATRNHPERSLQVMEGGDCEMADGREIIAWIP